MKSTIPKRIPITPDEISGSVTKKNPAIIAKMPPIYVGNLFVFVEDISVTRFDHRIEKVFAARYKLPDVILRLYHISGIDSFDPY